MSDLKLKDLNVGDEVTITWTLSGTVRDDVYSVIKLRNELGVSGVTLDTLESLVEQGVLAASQGTLSVERHRAAPPAWHSAQVIQANINDWGERELLIKAASVYADWLDSDGDSWCHEDLSDVEVLWP